MYDLDPEWYKYLGKLLQAYRALGRGILVRSEASLFPKVMSFRPPAVKLSRGEKPHLVRRNKV